MAIGTKILDLSKLTGAGFGPEVECAFQQTTLNKFMELNEFWSPSRAIIRRLLTTSGSVPVGALVDQSSAEMHLPATIGDYTDFYSSENHAANVGKMFRPTMAPLLENWKWIPVGYHGRASTVFVSGKDIHRPHGQRKADTGLAFGV